MFIIPCFHCGDDHTYQYAVKSWFRDAEDADRGSYSIATLDSVATYRELKDHNPSPRRDGVEICLRCEVCSGTTLVIIYQHKGVTNMDFLKGFSSSCGE